MGIDGSGNFHETKLEVDINGFNFCYLNDKVLKMYTNKKAVQSVILEVTVRCSEN